MQVINSPASLLKACKDARPGSKYIIEGTIELPEPLPPLFTGEPSRPIVFKGAPGSLIRGRNSWIGFNFMPGAGFFEFEDLTIRGTWAAFVFFQAPGEQAIHHVTMRGLDLADCEKGGIYARNAGVQILKVYKSKFHHCYGTEGNVDIGEWKDPALQVRPQSASRNIIFEDCDFYEARHQQGNGIVTQPCVSNVTLRRCRAWKNGKYGFGLKGSGNFRLDDCIAFHNGGNDLYLRGFDREPPAKNVFTVNGGYFVSAPDQRGGAAVCWRENCDVVLLGTTIVGNRDGSMPGGYALRCDSQQTVPTRLRMQACTVVGATDKCPAVLWKTNGEFMSLGGNRFYSLTKKPFKVHAPGFELHPTDTVSAEIPELPPLPEVA